MRLPWFHNRRQEILEQPFSGEWKLWLDSGISQAKLLTPDERTRLEGDLRIFAAEKFWEGVGGLDITDEIKVVVSAQACLLTLGMVEHDYFPNVESIIIYPSSYRAPSAGPIVGGRVQVVDSHQDRLGEAHGNGPVILSWFDTVTGGANSDDGRNLVLHEFSHKLDFRNGSPDGVPRLKTQEQFDRWAEVMSAEYAQLVESAEHHRHSLLRNYGATNPAEFFAVATEAFFEKSVRMRQDHPALYEVLLGYYGIDWAARVEGLEAGA
jgi:MtfA peptidase